MQYQQCPPSPHSTVCEVIPNFLTASAWLVVFAGKLWQPLPCGLQYGCLAVMTSAATIHCDVKWPYSCSSGLDMCLTVTW